MREATIADAHEIARLLTLLGHPCLADDIGQRWHPWQAEGNRALVVAAPGGGGLHGLISLHRMWVLHRPRPVGRITALVVDESRRGHGLGRQLVAAAEAIFREAGCGLVELTSHRRLQDAHAFYAHLGYEQSSLRFVRVLEPDARAKGVRKP